MASLLVADRAPVALMRHFSILALRANPIQGGRHVTNARPPRELVRKSVCGSLMPRAGNQASDRLLRTMKRASVLRARSGALCGGESPCMSVATRSTTNFLSLIESTFLPIP
jgi:hypothetical protein